MWNRLVSLRALGAELQLVLWLLPSESITEEQSAGLKLVASDIVIIPRKNSPADFLHVDHPPRMYSYRTGGDVQKRSFEQIVLFMPDWIWLEGWPGYLFAKKLCDEHHFRLVYRSQNVEHQYFNDLVAAAKGIQKFILWTNASKLFRSETELRAYSAFVLDITEEDALWWNVPLNQGKWRVLPTGYSGDVVYAQKEKSIDIGYVGSLRGVNNREGLEWFIRSVLPVLRQQMRGPINISFIGAAPPHSFVELCKRESITVIASPESVKEYFETSRILINPLQKGNGINLKMLEMLGSGNMIVTTSAGARGIPSELRSGVAVADSPELFAAHCVTYLVHPVRLDQAEIRRGIEKHFGEHHLKELLTVLSA